jgi:hypothetical protein
MLQSNLISNIMIINKKDGTYKSAILVSQGNYTPATKDGLVI